ncbi:beta-galactosidase [Paractinoplanes deccanensis]|uniref:beta-galactosidase n=1 Tax=Paractinoplanes deccanensis TaxID=113561 RepID=A0ABQ3XYT9_9ACTN|nr:beta-galactosidase [Actinoplanes deccanensis]
MVLAVLAAALGGAVPRTPVPATAKHTVTYDKYSLLLDGKRTYIWSGEFAYWRLPSPGLWRDVLQKMKANGYNAVSIYFNWAYHSPKRGVYDFGGVRDVDLLLDIAAQTGLYVIARPGPYINAETSSGGFPGWLSNDPGRARSDAPSYLAAADEWMTRIDAIIGRHQFTEGTGTVILQQIENELFVTGAAQQRYMLRLARRVRADGITVPIFHNDVGRNGYWVPRSSEVPGTVEGPTGLYAFDAYVGPQRCGEAPKDAPDFGLWGPGGAKGGASASPRTPGFTAEFGGGWFDHWGGPGAYPCLAREAGSGYQRVFYGTNIANGLSIQNFYMTYGGTSWGWLPSPVVYTSYDYGAAIDEARQPRPKATTMKQLGMFVQSFAPLTELDRGDPVTPSSAKVKVYHDVNPHSGAHLYVAMHHPSSATTDDAFTFPISTEDGDHTLAVRLNGLDAKLLVADYDMDAQHLVYSTSELMTHFAGTALFHGRRGESGETVLRYPSAPAVSGDVRSSYDAATGDLRLTYVHDGLTEVRITGGGRPPLTLLLADDEATATLWRQDTPAGPVLVSGPALVRTATYEGSDLLLSGDTTGRTSLRVWGAPPGTRVRWNGRLDGADPVRLPDLVWRSSPGSPEADPGYDDSGWQPAGRTTTAATTPPPPGEPVLTADDYGFHQGDVWYRGRWTGSVETLRIRYGGGGAGLAQVWVDGAYLGQNVLPAGKPSPPRTATATFTVPSSSRTAGQHVVAVMVRNNGHTQDVYADDAHKEGRGLISTSLGAAATWRIQGNLGGEDPADPVRGITNAGGLAGERAGVHLPGYPDAAWHTAAVPAATAAPGTTWYRSTFRLAVPAGHDASLGLTIGDPGTPRSAARYRALIFLNGWNLGQYIADVGPQGTFVLPNGILDPHGVNTLALAVTSDGGPGNGLEKVALTNLGTVRGGVDVPLVAAPAWAPTGG